MQEKSVEKIFSTLNETDLVLDIGAWACPFNRANWIIDALPYETRGFYKTLGGTAFQGGEKEYFTKDTWVTVDICDRKPWPFEDKQFDFTICSHLLEDVRDPLFVCSEIMRVSKAGYIETPSRLYEQCLGVVRDEIAGCSHHRWLVQYSDHKITFNQKYHTIHTDFDLTFPPEFGRSLPIEKQVSTFYWKDSFEYEEPIIHGEDGIYTFLRDFVKLHYQYPAYKYKARDISSFTKRIYNGIKRRV